MDYPDFHIPKDEMVDGAMYIGTSRNATFAEWNERKGKFVHIGDHFGNAYLEEIEHWDDVADTGYDGFIPFEKVDRYETTKEYHKLRNKHYKKTYDKEEEHG